MLVFTYSSPNVWAASSHAFCRQGNSHTELWGWEGYKGGCQSGRIPELMLTTSADPRFIYQNPNEPYVQNNLKTVDYGPDKADQRFRDGEEKV